MRLRPGHYGLIAIRIGVSLFNRFHRCVLSIIRTNLTEEDVQIFPVFESRDRIEPGECIDDTCFWCIEQPIHDIVWVKLRLRAVSNGVEWHMSGMIRIEDQNDTTLTTQDEVI